MSQSIASGAKWRTVVWAVGTLACLAFYSVNAVHFPKRTPLGTEQRLFAKTGLDPRLNESPGGGRWFLVPAEWSALPEAFPTVPLLDVLPSRLRVLASPGTWLLGGGSMRRLWRHAAGRWIDENHLLGSLWGPSVDGTVHPINAGLDLRSGRSVIPAEGMPYDAFPLSWEEEEWSFAEEPSALDTISSGLEGESQLIGQESKSFTIAGRRVHILYGAENSGEGIRAVSDELAPRVLPIVPSGRLVALSTDGRTLFFTRKDALWRLDLRKPLPELLDEVPIPELPIPTR